MESVTIATKAGMSEWLVACPVSAFSECGPFTALLSLFYYFFGFYSFFTTYKN